MSIENAKCHLVSDELLAFYEKHYFHEVDMREKLLARVQVAFALIASLGSMLFYLVSNIKTFSWSSLCCLIFVGLSVFSFILLFVSVVFFLKSFFNYTYRFVPTAKATDNYLKQLLDTYKEYDDCDDLVAGYFKAYLLNAYIDSATDNAENNAWRSANFHNTVKYLIPAYLLAFFSLFFFYAGKINKAPLSNVNVKVVEPIQLQGGTIMSDAKKSEKPPPPPPPPPLRQIREGLEVTKPSIVTKIKKDK